MLITSDDILNTLGKKVKQARKKLGYTQEFVAENLNVSTDLLRGIENGRTLGSITTLLNLCNFLKVSPNTLFSELLDFKEDTLDSTLTTLLTSISDTDRKVLKDVILHIDKNYYINSKKQLEGEVIILLKRKLTFQFTFL